MSVQEPTTLATDYMLCIAAAFFAARLWRVHRMWALAFAFTSAASLFGGTYHGFAPVLSALAEIVLWKATVLSVGLASCFLMAGASRRLIAFAVVKFVVYASWMIVHDDFSWVILDYGITLVIVGIALRRNGWVLSSIAVSVLAALVQQSGLTLHRHFNHNDLYHVIQLVALWLLYRGGLAARQGDLTT
jgi:hypothetical protein